MTHSSHYLAASCVWHLKQSAVRQKQLYCYFCFVNWSSILNPYLQKLSNAIFAVFLVSHSHLEQTPKVQQVKNDNSKNVIEEQILNTYSIENRHPCCL